VVGVDAAKPSTLVQAFEGADYAVIVTPHDAAAGMDVRLFTCLVVCLLVCDNLCAFWLTLDRRMMPSLRAT
jgi:hypothetical protein